MDFIALLLSVCHSHGLVGRNWRSADGGVSSEMAFTGHHGYVRRYWTVDPAPEPFVRRYSSGVGILRFESRETVSGVSPAVEAPFCWSEEKLTYSDA